MKVLLPLWTGSSRLQGGALAHVRDGLSNSAACSERVLGDDDDGHVDMDSDLFGLDSPWTEATLRDWCLELTEAEAATLHIQDSNGA